MTGGLPGPDPHDRQRPTGRRNDDGIRIDPEAEAEHEARRAVLSALVEHRPGVLADVSGLFSRRQFNIESLTVGSTTDEDRARMTIVIEESEPGVEQAKKQLGKLIPVISVRELESDAIQRELVILKVNGDEPDKVQAITEMYDGDTLDAGPRTITVEITGDEQKIDDAIDAYEQFGIREIVRTGYAALARGEQPTAAVDEATQVEASSKEVPADDD
jgi:acetolactate synthase-1/3 small subunit